MTSRRKLGRRKMGRVEGVTTGRRIMDMKMGKKVARMMASKTMQTVMLEAGTAPLAAPITLQMRVLLIGNILRPTTDMTTKVTTKIATRMGTWQ